MDASQCGLDHGTDEAPPPAFPMPTLSADGADGPVEPDQSAAGAAQLAAADERERLSRDLHDLVLQRLFGLAATLSALSTSTSDERTAERLQTCVHDLDQTIDAIRDGILDQTPLQAPPAELRVAPPAAVVALAQAVVADHS